MSTAAPHDPTARELFEQIASWPIFDRTRTSMPGVRRRGTSTRCSGITTIPNWPTRPGCRRPRSTRGSIPDVAPRISPGISTGSTTRCSTRGCWRSSRTFLGFEGERIDPETIDGLWRASDHGNDGEDWDRSVWERTNLEAVFPDQRVRRPARRLGHLEIRPLPADGRSGPEAPRAEDAPAPPGRLERGGRRREVAPIGGVEPVRVLRRSRGRGACAISLPPDFRPRRSTPLASQNSLRRALTHLDLRPDEHEEIRTLVFWMVGRVVRGIPACPSICMIGLDPQRLPE